MHDMLAFLKELISVAGLSGFEAPVRRLLEEAWKPWVDDLSTSQVGSLQARLDGNGPEPRPSVMLAAHMDAIGLMVAGVEGEFLRLAAIGGVDPRVLPGQQVVVHGRQELPAVIMQLPANYRPPGESDETVKINHLRVDTGLTASDLADVVRPGDVVSFAQMPIDLPGNCLAGHSLDNRASLAAVTMCLELLQTRKHAWDVWAVATVQEELAYGGAYTSAFALRPTLGVAVDVTYGSGPEDRSHETYPVGQGITLGWGPNIHPGMYRTFESLAKNLEIPYVMEAMPKHSGTDAYAMQVTAAGIPTMVVSIPVRYLHTPVEMVALADIERAGRLLAEFVVGLDQNYMAELSCDE